MDDGAFDDVTRLFVQTESRRTIARTMLGGVGGAMLLWLGASPAAAKCINPGKKCDKRDTKKSKCCSGTRCKGRRCRCTGGRAGCGPKCCPKGQICGGGRCVTGQASCPAGADSCTAPVLCSETDPLCLCFQRIQGGTRCVQSADVPTECNQCANDAECRDLGFPPGSSCVRDSGANCGCDPGAGGFCFAPCDFGAGTTGA